MRFVFYLTILLIGLTACAAETASAPPVSCTMDFEATVHQGPSAGASLVGELALQVEPSGTLNGRLTQPNGAQVPVSGQGQGRAINLVFELSDEQYVFGVGSAQHDIRECRGVGGGPFTGPQPGDSGDWGYALGGARGQ